MERYKGTPYESQPAPSAAPPTNLARIQLRLFLLWWALFALIVGLLFAEQAGFFDILIPNEGIIVMLIAVPWIAATLSKVIPGRKARGPFKGWLVGYLGWWLAEFAALFVGGFTFTLPPWELAFYIDQAILATVGTVVLRVIFWFFD